MRWHIVIARAADASHYNDNTAKGTMQRAVARRGAADDRTAPPFLPASGAACDPGDAGISVRVARTLPDRRAATELIRSRYSSRGYAVSDLPTSPTSELTLLATEAEDAVGTLTLRLDGPDGLRADDTYADQIDAARTAGRRICKLGRFAVAEHAPSGPVLAALFAHAHAAVRSFGAITDVFIEVNPRHAGFYRRLFGFAIAGGERVCARVGAPSVLLRLDATAFEARLAQAGA
jgi:hypothetical protein